MAWRRTASKNSLLVAQCTKKADLQNLPCDNYSTSRAGTWNWCRPQFQIPRTHYLNVFFLLCFSFIDNAWKSWNATLQLDLLQKCSSRSTCEEAPCLRSLTGNTILSGELAWVAQKISFSGSKQCWLWGLCWVNNSTSNKQYLRVWFLRSHTPELEYTQRMLKSMGLKVT